MSRHINGVYIVHERNLTYKGFEKHVDKPEVQVPGFVFILHIVDGFDCRLLASGSAFEPSSRLSCVFSLSCQRYVSLLFVPEAIRCLTEI